MFSFPLHHGLLRFCFVGSLSSTLAIVALKSVKPIEVFIANRTLGSHLNVFSDQLLKICFIVRIDKVYLLYEIFNLEELHFK